MYCTHLLIMWNPNVRNLLSLLIACRFHATKMTQYNNISSKMLFKKCFQKYACTKSNDFDHICCSLPLPKCTYPSLYTYYRLESTGFFAKWNSLKYIEGSYIIINYQRCSEEAWSIEILCWTFSCSSPPFLKI